MCVCVCVCVCDSVINCGDPDDLANGLRWFRTTTLGSFVKYKCNSGYKMVGYQYRKCLSSGAWSGRAPTCRGEQSVANDNFDGYTAYI